MKCLRGLSVLAVSLLLGLSAAPSPAESVLCGTFELGEVELLEYSPRYGTGKEWGDGTRDAGDLWGGTSFITSFTFEDCPPDMMLRPGLEFRWVQIVHTNSPISDDIRGDPPDGGYVDPWSKPGGSGYEDEKPFYWTDAEYAANWDSPTSTLTFSDRSKRPFSNDTITWGAELNLVCTWDKKVHVLGHWTWGWIMDPLPDPDVTRDPLPPTWTDGASFGFGDIVTSSAEFGTFGWTVTDECCCIIPEPATAFGIALGCLALCLRLRQRTRPMASRRR